LDHAVAIGDDDHVVGRFDCGALDVNETIEVQQVPLGRLESLDAVRITRHATSQDASRARMRMPISRPGSEITIMSRVVLLHVLVTPQEISDCGR